VTGDKQARAVATSNQEWLAAASNKQTQHNEQWQQARTAVTIKSGSDKQEWQ